MRGESKFKLGKEYIIYILNKLILKRENGNLNYVNHVKDKAKLYYFNSRILILKNDNTTYLIERNYDLNDSLLKKKVITNLPLSNNVFIRKIANGNKTYHDKYSGIRDSQKKSNSLKGKNKQKSII